MYKGMVLKSEYAQYVQDGISYPAYCLDREKQGVNGQISYNVSINEKVTDIGLWRVIINAYPYKSLEELGCRTKEEAFMATKQAVYCYIHGNDVNDYSAIGEAGQRTLNALHKIVNDATNSTEMQISNKVDIIKQDKEFTVDSKEPEYVYKLYSIKSKTTMSNYQITLNKIGEKLPEGIKITDINNNMKSEFSSNEIFKILIPIKNLTETTDFKINITTKINNKPVLYGRAPNSLNQDYALSAATYEEAEGEISDTSYKNETKLKIIKQNGETKERLENVEFNILDKNKQIVYNNLKTNEHGEIEVTNLLPGKYYIQETKSKEGYLLNKELVEFEIEYNQELIIEIDNSMKEKPEIKITTIKENVKKLPITGM
ncbi:MAG: Cys-Gln thioester bond-forming surface protein [Clostridia bacterium]|nr:Cys-Gln thioester bond-forming surface protein [Clostridia bacterium]